MPCRDHLQKILASTIKTFETPAKGQIVSPPRLAIDAMTSQRRVALITSINKASLGKPSALFPDRLNSQTLIRIKIVLEN